MERCLDRELLDTEEVTAATLALAYRQLRSVHNWLGNTAAVLRLLRPEADARRVQRVLDIGCGQGALLVEIKRKLGLDVIGIDLRPAPAGLPVAILQGNGVTDRLPLADVAICMVMAHHLSEAELTGLIRNVARSCRRLILLDLVRHPVPLMLFRTFVAPLLCRINAQDGQTSIRRAYTVLEMRKIVDEALATSQPSVLSRVRHTVSPFWIRQVVDIAWDAAAG